MELKLHHPTNCVNPGFLLIVPYGIETQQALAQSEFDLSFNCTLWN